MKFFEFFKLLRTHHKCEKIKDFYEKFGGEKFFELSLRSLQLIDQGSQHPSMKLFEKLFSLTPSEFYIHAIKSYFQSTEDKSPINSYLQNHLTSAYPIREKSLWETEEHITLSIEQLETLSSSLELMSAFHKVLLNGKIEVSSLNSKENELFKKLCDMELIKKSGSSYKNTYKIYRIPKFGSAKPTAVRTANNYLLKHLDNYVSLEGSNHQELGYSLNMVSEETAGQILKQIEIFKQWVQSTSLPESGNSKKVPFFFLSVGKTLANGEL